MRRLAALLLLLASSACGGDTGIEVRGSAALAIDVDSGELVYEPTAGPSAPLEVGWVTTSAGDVDGDGFDDVLVTSVKEASTSHGSARVFRSTGSGLATTPLWTVTGLDNGELGSAGAGVGDLDGDGYDDLVLGEPAYGTQEQGRILIFLGSPTGPSPSADRIVDGSTESDARTGASIAGVGDLNGDGRADFVVGEPGVDAAGADAGRLLVFLGADPLPPAFAAAASIPGTQAQQRLGSRLAALGDIDGDHHPDLLASNPDWDSETGRVEVYLGDGFGLGATPAMVLGSVDPGERYGAAIAGPGDLDGDGLADAVVGAPGWLDGTDPLGRVHVLGGSTQAAQPLQFLTILQGDLTSDRLHYGSALSALGDVNADGLADFLVTRESSAPAAGNVGEIVHGGDFGAGFFQRFGDCELSLSRGAGVDTDRDGYPELILGEIAYGPTCGMGSPPGRIERFTGGGEGLDADTMAT
jgi:hypothetical protein